MTRRQTLIVAVLVFLGMVVIGFLASTLNQDKYQFSARPAPKYVQTTEVEYGLVNTTITTFGRVESSQPVELIAEVSGRILSGSVPLKQSQNFRRGQLLFRIDDSEARLALKSRKSEFLRDLATILPDLKIDFADSYEQWNQYFQSISIDRSLPELPEHKTDKEKTFLATKNIFSTYFEIKRSETNLAKHLIYAPFDGSFSEVTLETGAYVNGGSRIARIVRTGKLELKVPVETADIDWIKEGGEVQVSTENRLQTWDGRIKRIGEVVNQNTQSIDVIIDIIPNQNTIYDGLYLRAEIPGESIPDAMEVDRSALHQGDKIFVVEQDSVLKVKDIDIHRMNSKTVVFNGVEAGAAMVTEPLINAYNNMIVTTKLSQDSTSVPPESD